MTKRQLTRFVARRNKSRFGTNLQFIIDLQEVGLSTKDLGNATAREGGGYEWATPHGLLIEHPGGKMELREQADAA